MINKEFHLVTLMVRGGVEPPTFRFSGAYAASLDVAERGLMGDLDGTVADRFSFTHDAVAIGAMVRRLRAPVSLPFPAGQPCAPAGQPRPRGGADSGERACPVTAGSGYRSPPPSNVADRAR